MVFKNPCEAQVLVSYTWFSRILLRPKSTLSTILQQRESVYGISNLARTSKYHPILNSETLARDIRNPRVFKEALCNLEKGDVRAAKNFFIWSQKHVGYSHKVEAYARMCYSLAKSGILLEDVIHSFALSCNPRTQNWRLVHLVVKMAYKEGKCTQVFDILIWSFLRAEKFMAASRIFYMALKYGCSPGFHKCDGLLNGLLRKKHMRRLREVYNAIRTAKLEMNVWLLGTMIHVACRLGIVDDAKRLFVESKKLGCSIVIYNTLINSYCKNKDIVGAMDLYDDMINNGFQPNISTYNTILDGLCSARKIHEAVGLLRTMEKFSDPDVITYTILIGAHCKDGMVGEALDLYDEMCKKDIEPTHFTYNFLIKGLGRVNRTREALGLYDVMLRKGVEPTVYTYRYLVNMLCKRNRRRLSASIMGTMLKKGLGPRRAMYSALIGACCKNRSVPQAFRVHDWMLKQGIQTHPTILTSLLYGLFRARMLEEVAHLYTLMNESHTLDTVTYNVMIDGYCGLRNIGEALRLYHEMIDRGIQPDIVTFTPLVSHMFWVKNTSGVERLLREVSDRGLKPDFIMYHVLVLGYIKLCNCWEAYMMLQKMQEDFVVPNNQLYHRLLFLCLRRGKFGIALKVSEEMAQKGVTMSPSTAERIFMGFCHLGKLEKVLFVLESVIERDLMCNHITYSYLIAGHCTVGNLAQATRYFNEMRKRGWHPDPCIHFMLMDGLRKQGNVKESNTIQNEACLQ